MSCIGRTATHTSQSAQLSPDFTSTFSGTRELHARRDISSRTSFASCIEFVRRDFEDQFVVDLQQHLATGSFCFCKPAVDVDHRQLDQVGGRALDDRVDRGAFRQVALRERIASSSRSRSRTP